MTDRYRALVDGAAGIYVPFKFANNFDWSKWRGITQEQQQILLKGPNYEDYWAVWDEVLQSAWFENDEGCWILDQDGDLFAYKLTCYGCEELGCQDCCEHDDTESGICNDCSKEVGFGE